MELITDSGRIGAGALDSFLFRPVSMGSKWQKICILVTATLSLVDECLISPDIIIHNQLKVILVPEFSC